MQLECMVPSRSCVFAGGRLLYIGRPDLPNMHVHRSPPAPFAGAAEDNAPQFRDSGRPTDVHAACSVETGRGCHGVMHVMSSSSASMPRVYTRAQWR
eukprot:353234-Chlamydomonas_euryale.AAC.4